MLNSLFHEGPTQKYKQMYLSQNMCKVFGGRWTSCSITCQACVVHPMPTNANTVILISWSSAPIHHPNFFFFKVSHNRKRVSYHTPTHTVHALRLMFQYRKVTFDIIYCSV